MAQYINKDKLKGMIQAKADTLIEGKEAFLYIEKWLDLLPSEDGIPRSEWVNVEDSTNKPRHLQECFIAYVFGDSEMIFYGSARYHAFEGNGLVEGPHFSNEGVEGMKVKYWMPIPKITKMKSEEGTSNEQRGL